MESSKPRTIRGKILMIFILTVIPFMMISALISTYSIETSNERVEASYTTLLEMLKRDIDNDLAIIDSNMRLQFTTNDTLFMQFANATNQSDSAFFRTNLYNELQNSTRSISALYSYFVFSPVYYPKIPLLVYSGVKTIEETQKMKEAIMDVVQEPQWMELSNGAWFMFSIGDKAFIAKIYQFNNAYIGTLIDSRYYLGRVEYASLDYKMVIADDVPSTNKNIVIRELSMFKNCYLCLTIGQTNGFAQLPCVLKLMISVLIIVSMGAILLLMHLARDILNPFRELTDNVELISKGDLSIRLPENNRYYEFSLLHRRFNSMMNEICDLKIQNYENEIKLKSLALQCRQL